MTVKERANPLAGATSVQSLRLANPIRRVELEKIVSEKGEGEEG